MVPTTLCHFSPYHGVCLMGEGINMEDIGKHGTTVGQVFCGCCFRIGAISLQERPRSFAREWKRPGRPGKSARCFGIFPKSGPQASWMYIWNYLNAFPYYYYSMILNWPVWSVNARNALKHSWRFWPSVSQQGTKISCLILLPNSPPVLSVLKHGRVGKSTIWWFFHYIILTSSIAPFRPTKRPFPARAKFEDTKKLGSRGWTSRTSSPKLMWKPRASP